MTAQAAGDPEKWESAELKRSKEISVTLSFRVPGALAERIEQFAMEHDVTVSEVLRRAVESFVEGGGRETIAPFVASYTTARRTDLSIGVPRLRQWWTDGEAKNFERAPDAADWIERAAL